MKLPEGPNEDRNVSAAGESDGMTPPRTALDDTLGLARELATNDIDLDLVEQSQSRAIIYVRVSTKAQAERDGNPEGYSLPTQRTACRLRAEQLGAIVVDEYIDKDTGTRVDKRPAMLALIERVTEKRDVDYVIVHQLSRFARNRLDDASITDSLEMAGAVLISCMEGIDQTTPGRMLQGMLAVVNEYQSRNQSDDIKRKTLQKVKDGGTPALAPIGYLNVQGDGGDKNKRWVEVDPVRAGHIKWAFEAYASGIYSLHELTDALGERGLLQRSTARRPERPLPRNKLHQVLRNRYYTGIVTHKGIEYEGKHPPLVDATTFEQVQRLLEAHRQSGERAHRHTHYLKGSLRCFRCKSRLAYCVSRGNGGSYEYFFCLGRHERRTNCDLPHLNPEKVELAIVDFYLGDQLNPEELEALRALVLEDLAQAAKRTESERKRLIAQVTEIRHTRYQWAEKAMAETVPGDIAREKQLQLSCRLAKAESDLALLDRITAETRVDIDRIFELARKAASSYRSSSDKLRREWNLARYEALEIDVEEGQPVVAEAHLTPIFEAIRTADVRKPRTTSMGRSRTGPVMCHVAGSRVELLVEAKGLEPSNLLTASQPMRRPAGGAQYL